MTKPKEVATMIIVDHDRVLILKRGKKSPGAGTWNFPGGGVEDGETFETAAIRETKEEAGLIIDPEHVIYVGTLKFKYLNVNTFITNQYQGVVQINHESDDFRWVTLTEIVEYPFVGNGKLNEDILKKIKDFMEKHLG